MLLAALGQVKLLFKSAEHFYHRLRNKPLKCRVEKFGLLAEGLGGGNLISLRVCVLKK